MNIFLLEPAVVSGTALVIFTLMSIVNFGVILFIFLPELKRLRKQYEQYFRMIVIAPLGIFIQISYKCTGYSFDGWLGWYCSLYELIYTIVWTFPWFIGAITILASAIILKNFFNNSVNSVGKEVPKKER